MFVRVNTVTGAKDMDAGVEFLRDKVVPEVRGQKGFRGLTASGNRSTGEFGILSIWESLLRISRPARALFQSSASRQSQQLVARSR